MYCDTFSDLFLLYFEDQVCFFIPKESTRNILIFYFINLSLCYTSYKAPAPGNQQKILQMQQLV